MDQLHEFSSLTSGGFEDGSYFAEAFLRPCEGAMKLSGRQAPSGVAVTEMQYFSHSVVTACA
jgi:hypothetical protein